MNITSIKQTSLKAAALVAALSAATAGANSFGGSVGSGVSVHYQIDRTATTAIRYGLDLNAVNFNFGALSLGGTVDYLQNFSGSTLGVFVPYYGFGLGAGIRLGDNTGVSLYPHGLLGLKYNITGPWSVFGEVNAGISVGIGSGSNFSFGSGARIGVNYRIN
ncbi:hypothetical protein [Deinococcus sp.]|uniref:hypothetical protein n=1 Tax=Deinococcus sp. TaxID=47478 RepID=UPI003B590FCC